MIEELAGAVRRFARFEPPLDAPKGLFGGLRMAIKMLPVMGTFRKYSKTSVQDFVRRFSDPFLRQAFALMVDMPDFPMLAVLMMLAYMHKRNAGFPVGGSLEFSRAIERRYLDLGGEIHYKSRVEKILVKDNRAVGVRLADGSEHHADVVISAADGHATIFDMLEGKHVNDEIRGYYDTWPIFPPLVQVSLGVARDLSNEPHMCSYPLEEPVTIAGEAQKRMSVKHYCYDPTLAPAGKSVVEVMFPSNYAYWKGLAAERERYEAEKQQVALTVIGQLEKRFPGITGDIEAVDVATPLTYERYTGNWRGSMEGWMVTTKTIGLAMGGKGMSKTLPGLENLYMAGQWVEPGGGVPTAAMSGRNVMRTICQRDGKPFVTVLP